MSFPLKFRHWALIVGHWSFTLGLCAEGVQFRVLSWDGPIQGLKYDADRTPVEITAADDCFSPPYSIKKTAPLELYRDPQPGRERMPVAMVPAPDASFSRAILVLAATSDGRYAGRWIDDSPETHPAGTLRIHNFTRLPLAFQSGARQWQQAPGEVHSIGIAPSLRQTPLRIAGLINGKWDMLWGSLLPMRKNYRVHVFVRDIPPPGEPLSDPVYPLILYDYVAPAPATGTPG